MPLELSSPVPFREAVSQLAQRRLMPTNLTSAELREIASSIRQRSLFSARNYFESVLEQIKRDVGDILSPRTVTREDGTQVTEGINPAQARENIREALRRVSYDPGDDRGSLKDLSSDRRIDLVVKTNVEQAQGFGAWRKGQDPDLLDEFPALELFRAEDREKERNWIERFRVAASASGRSDGWTLEGGRMIALKNHPIWDELGSSAHFDDGLDTPFPPFAFNSGMWTRPIDRDEAMALGLIDRDTQIAPRTESFDLPDALLQPA